MEHAPQLSNLPTGEKIIDIATELFGEDSDRVSDIKLVLEEGNKNPKIQSNRIEEARAHIIDGISQGEMKEAKLSREMVGYFTQLYVPPASIERILRVMYPKDASMINKQNFGHPDQLH